MQILKDGFLKKKNNHVQKLNLAQKEESNIRNMHYIMI